MVNREVKKVALQSMNANQQLQIAQLFSQMQQHQQAQPQPNVSIQSLFYNQGNQPLQNAQQQLQVSFCIVVTKNVPLSLLSINLN